MILPFSKHLRYPALLAVNVALITLPIVLGAAVIWLGLVVTYAVV